MNLIECLKSFTTVVENNSFSAASRLLNVSPSKVSKQINWLEDELRMKLFIRSTKQLILTDAGKTLYEKAGNLFEEIRDIHSISQSKKNHLQGKICLYLTVSPAVTFFTSLGIEFMKLHPDISLEIIAGSDHASFFQHSFDLSISFEPISYPNLMCKKLFSVQRNVYGSDAYLNRNGNPETAEDLRHHNCLINTLYGLQNKWILNNKIIHVQGSFQSNNACLLKQAAIADIGLIWAPHFTVMEEVEKGLLLPVLGNQTSPEIMLYAIYKNHKHKLNLINELLAFFCNKVSELGIIDL
ncbi:LysR family transcriptional regulator [Legionella quinlivanii]|uniref:LysR family transcriptional regulator n=1 Tax=Legionella quinlivanii TaxID=45073 RepID=A0A0W0Y913_9GAMM|nr:LysR family transcriptional regulator [Legionella quinlivanii]KTD53086.1 LysR family transcriptional regulator [Legionella quinlivanii]SEG17155.1 transcriptional regulator, LysR family [Legionella quinlivanii DSM 21216]STY10467.1 LysR family transcriptional regulator [Legionella quinlivanii]